MKILIVRAFPSLIDLKKNCYNQQEVGLAAAFLSLGHEAGIVYYGGDSHRDETHSTEYGDIRIYYRKARVLLKRIALFEDFSDLKEAYDLIISNEYDQVETVKTLKKYAQKTLIYHGPYYAAFNKRYNLANKIFDLLFLRTIRRIHPRIMTKSVLAKEFVESKGLEVLTDVGVGLDAGQMLSAAGAEARVDIDFEADKRYLLYIGRLEPRRNTLFLLEVLEKLVREDDRYRLILVGAGNADYVAQVDQAIAQKNLEGYILRRERLAQTQLPYLYRNSHMFLLPTEYEIWGMVLMEALFFGCPVLTTRNGGSAALIQSGVNGAVSELDVDKWTEQIREMCYDRKALQQYNDAVLAEKCDWVKIAQRMLEV